MIITAAKIEVFNPCKDRIENFKNHNPDFKGNVADFLSLDNITYTDKIWVCTRLMSRNQKFQFAVACAELVLPIYQVHYPNDTRVRDLIEFMKTISNIEVISESTKSKLLELRHAAYDAAAYAAYAAYDAAAYAAYAAYDAAAYAAAAAHVAARKTQENLNLILLADIMENVK